MGARHDGHGRCCAVASIARVHNMRIAGSATMRRNTGKVTATPWQRPQRHSRPAGDAVRASTSAQSGHWNIDILVPRAIAPRADCDGRWLRARVPARVRCDG
jgi:hypothetical protein